MDQELLVRELIDDGRLLLDRLAADGFPVTAAGWLKTYYDGQDYLYLVSPAAGDAGFRAGYAAVHDALRRSVVQALTPFEVKLLGPSEPLAKGLVEASPRRPGQTHAWHRGGNLEGVGIDGPAYIYAPVPAPAPTA